VGLTANAAVAHAAAAVPNHLSAEVQDLGAPLGITIDVEYADGGIILGDTPGVGLTLDEDAITAATSDDGNWLVTSGPHVRPTRAGLTLVPSARTDLPA
jgi:hypothetical protein